MGDVLMTWMREPDNVEHASLEWLIEWVNRRPIAELAKLQEYVGKLEGRLAWRMQ